MGAALTYTEMISSKGLAYGNKRTQEMIASLPEDVPYAVQLFGNEPEVMAAEARALEEQLGENLALIDINMGCPARKVTSGGNGAALLQNPELAASIVLAVSSAVEAPVTVKMRLVHESDDSATLSFAERLAQNGAAALAIHGRTAEQYYRGSARKDMVGLLARKLVIPVIASGDVFSQEDIEDYWQQGASAVMVARGARGNPWIFAAKKPSSVEIVELVREHTIQLFEWEPRKLVWMRKHFAWYFKGSAHAVNVRKAVQTAETLDDYLAILDGVQTREEGDGSLYVYEQ